MNNEPLAMVERAVLEWPGVTTGDTGRGGLQFSYGRVEFGHLHGSSFADLPFPKKVRDELIVKDQHQCTHRCPSRARCAGGLTAPTTGRP